MRSLTATHRAILTGYGGFAIAETPAWSPTDRRVVRGRRPLRGRRPSGWLSRKARPGTTPAGASNKQNVFDDFHAAADHLVATGAPRADRLAIRGGSNGGLLVGAALTQRPDLCRAVHCAVPLLDMVRYPQFLIARLWTDEYGDPEKPDELGLAARLLAVPPRAGRGLLPGGAADDGRGRQPGRSAPRPQDGGRCCSGRVGCQHERPILLHQESRAGHGRRQAVAASRPTSWPTCSSFFTWQLGVAAGT